MKQKMVLSKHTKKTIKQLVIFKIILITVIVVLIVPIFPVEPEFTIACVSEPCIVEPEFVNGFELIRRGLT